jgi:peroxiredoxin
MRVYAISGDPADTLRELQAELGLAVTLLSDPEGEALGAFGMRDPAGIPHKDTARAGTFLIDRQGRVARYWLPSNYRSRPSVDEILRHLIP